MNLSDFSRKGGKAGTGEAKKRTSSFTSASSQKALAARWGKRKPKRVARRSNDGTHRREAAAGDSPMQTSADSAASRSVQ